MPTPNISAVDRGTIVCIKSIFVRDNPQIYAKMIKAIDIYVQEEFKNANPPPPEGIVNEMKQSMMEGAALMYQVTKNPDFLKPVMSR